MNFSRGGFWAGGRCYFNDVETFSHMRGYVSCFGGSAIFIILHYFWFCGFLGRVVR